jgi:hypothetical protein
VGKQFTHAYSAITADFEIEPILADYCEKYPNNKYSDYQIVFKAIDEHTEGEFSYIIVFNFAGVTGKTNAGVDFYEFLKSYCVCENRVANINPVSHILPKIGYQGHTLGTPKKEKRV